MYINIILQIEYKSIPVKTIINIHHVAKAK
jgi:hypothetical protein